MHSNQINNLKNISGIAINGAKLVGIVDSVFNNISKVINGTAL